MRIRIQIDDMKPSDEPFRELFDRVDRLTDLMQIKEAIRLLLAEENVLLQSFSGCFYLGMAFYNDGDHATAEKYFAEASHLIPDKTAALAMRGFCLNSLERYSDAIKPLRQVLDSKERELVRNSLAFSYLKQGMLDEAEAVHRRGLELNPDSIWLRECYAFFLDDVGRTVEATWQYRFIEQRHVERLALDPANAQFAQAYADFLRIIERTRDADTLLARAEALLRERVLGQPNDPKALRTLAKFLRACEREAEALETFAIAHTIESSLG